MAKYDIWFSLIGDDERHYTTGIGSYPSDDQIDDNNYDYIYSLECALVFIDGYLDVERIKGRVDKGSIQVRISKE